jgi:quercetin dioxygenase-like cupin family protein
MEHSEFQKAQPFSLVECIEYVPMSIVIKTISRKITRNVSVVSFDSGEALSRKNLRFDTFIQIIEGMAEVQIDNKSHLLKTGESIIIPAHSNSTIKANVRFKMLSTIIKSGYEELS